MSKYRAIDGCLACEFIKRRGHQPGRLGHNHSQTCRDRIITAMRGDQQYRQLMQRHKQLATEAGVSRVEVDNRAIIDVDVIIEDQVNEKKHLTHGAMKHIKQQQMMRSNNLGSRLNETMLSLLIAHMDVVEVYSPRRVAEIAQRMGLREGWGLDLTTHDEDGRAWDFNHLEMRNRAMRKVLRDRPRLFIGSFTCTAYSIMNNINYARMSSEEVNERIRHARQHLEFCIQLYRLILEGRQVLIARTPQYCKTLAGEGCTEVASRGNSRASGG